MASQRTSVLFRVPARGVGRRDLLAFARKLEADVAGGRAFTCVISGDDELQRLNKQFRRKNHATDVLSFPADPGTASFGRGSVAASHVRGAMPPPGIRHLGEIAISIDRARAQGGRFGHSASDEIRILMLHGVLHLIGLNHERDNGQMARVEALWRRRLGLPTGLIERAS